MQEITLEVVLEWSSATKFSLCDFLSTAFGGSRAMRASMPHPVSLRPPIASDLRPSRPPRSSVLLRAPQRTHVRLRCSISRFTSFSIYLWILSELCFIHKYCGIFYLDLLQLRGRWTHNINHKVGTSSFANSNEIGCIRNVACPVFISIKGPFEWRFFYKDHKFIDVLMPVCFCNCFLLLDRVLHESWFLQ